MFNEVHEYTPKDSTDIPLVFIKSRDVQVFPCGRRRSSDIGPADNSYRIPFDPEARLNTEANNIKHSSLNGFTQTYLKDFDDVQLSLSLGGYLFNIMLEEGHNTVKDFAEKLVKNLSASEPTEIYANILVSSTQLFSNTYVGKQLSYNTNVLSGMVASQDEAALDLLAEDAASNETIDKYYFSGLAFSVVPVATLAKDEEYDEEYFKTSDECVKSGHKIISLRILEKAGGEWKIHEPARLPKIEHGDTEDSVILGDTTINSILTVKGDAVIENSLETKTLEVSERSNLKDLGVSGDALINKATIKEATIEDATITEAEITELTSESVESSSVYQKIKTGETTRTMQVPIIELVQNGDFYQLQITRIGERP